jgi:hypothetical protein
MHEAVKLHKKISQQNLTMKTNTLAFAIEKAIARPEAEREATAHAIVLGAYLKEIQRKRMDYPVPLDECRELLELFLRKHGNPHQLRLPKSLEVATLLAAITPEGEIASLYSTKTVKSVIEQSTFGRFRDRYYRETFDNLGVEVSTIPASDLDELLNDEQVVYHDGMLYPANTFYRGCDRYQLRDEMAVELERETEAHLQKKLESQIAFLDSLPYRSIEELCSSEIGLLLTSPVLPLEAIASFPPIQKMGNLFKRDGVFDIDTDRDTLTKDARTNLVYILNYLNRYPLTYSAESNKRGVDSKKGTEFIEELERTFNEWLPSSVYRQEVEFNFNHTFNRNIPITESCDPFHIEKLRIYPGMQPHPHQWQDARTLLQNSRGGGFLAVGLGKTLLALMVLLAGKQIGKWQKPLVVVPKPLIENWYSEILRWTKDVKLLTIGVSMTYWDKAKLHPAREIPGTQVQRDRKSGLPILKEGKYLIKPKKGSVLTVSGTRETEQGFEISPEDFDAQAKFVFKEDSATVKQQKLERLAVEEFDLVITIPESGFLHIPLSPAVEVAYTKELAMRGLFGDDDVKYFGKETINERIERLSKVASEMDYRQLEVLEQRQTAMVEMRGRKRDDIYFDNLGIDCLVFDEAHRGRNAVKPSRYDRVRGLNIIPSQRAHDMFLKSTYICEKGGGVFAFTATPICNNVADLYSLLRLFADDEMRAMGIETLDDFLGIFANIKFADGFDLSGELESVNTLVGLKLMPELRRLVYKLCVVRDRDSMSHLYPQARDIESIVPMTPIQSYLYEPALERMRIGMELQKEMDYEALKDAPHLRPLGILSDMDKIAFPRYYEESTNYGVPVPTTRNDFKAIADALGKAASELNTPIETYCNTIAEMAYERAFEVAPTKGINIFNEGGNISEEFKALEATFIQSCQEEIGDLTTFCLREFNIELKDGTERELMGATYQLKLSTPQPRREDTPSIDSLLVDLFDNPEKTLARLSTPQTRKEDDPPIRWEWRHIKGIPSVKDPFHSPKIEKAAQLCELYYHSGSVELRQPDGKTILTTPYHLFDSPEETLARWREIKPGQDYPAGRVISVGRGNVVLFCNFVGYDEKGSPTLFKEIAAAIASKGIPSEQIGFVCGSSRKGKSEDDDKEVLSRQAVAEWFNAGFLFAAIGTPGVMGEGLNLQGRVYPAVATIHLTEGWTQAMVEQCNGRVGRQGNRSNYVDNHHILSPGTSDINRRHTTGRKAGIMRDFFSDGEELVLEGDAPSLDELSELLARNPVAVKKRRAAAAAKAEILKKRKIEVTNRTRLYRCFNEMLSYLKIQDRSSLQAQAMKESAMMSRKNALKVLDNEKFGFLADPIPEDGILNYFVVPTGRVYFKDDWVRSQDGDLFRIWDIRVKGQELLISLLPSINDVEDKDNLRYRPYIYTVSSHEFSWGEAAIARFKHSAPSKSRLHFPEFPEYLRDTVDPKKGRDKDIYGFNILFLEPASPGKAESRISAIREYQDILFLFSEAELPLYRHQIFTHLTQQEIWSLFREESGRLIGKVTTKGVIQDFALPGDLHFKEELLLYVARHLNDYSYAYSYSKGCREFKTLAALLRWTPKEEKLRGGNSEETKVYEAGKAWAEEVGVEFLSDEQLKDKVKALFAGVPTGVIGMGKLTDTIPAGSGIPPCGLIQWLNRIGIKVDYSKHGAGYFISRPYGC